jgi:hypothetical protein
MGCGDVGSYLAVFIVVMTAGEQKFEGLFVAQDGSPSQRCIASSAWIRVA